MAEDTLESPLPVPSGLINRRTFVKGVAVTATGALATAAVGEFNVPKEGVKTPHADFIPVYEHHEKGVSESEIPEVDYLFKEAAGEFVYDMTPRQLLTAESERSGAPMFREGVLEKLAKQGTRVAYADFKPGSDADIQASTLKQYAEIAIATELPLVVAGIKNWLNRNKEEEPQYPRRSFLKILGLGAFGWAVSPPVTQLLLGERLKVAKDQLDAAARILERANALLSHLHPEDTTVFFRNALLAAKFLYTGEVFEREHGTKPKIGFDMGGAHAGIEDFLRAGREFCLWIVSQHDKEFLRRVAEQMGGVKNVATIRIFSLPADFKEEDLYDANVPSSVVESGLIDPLLKQVFEEQLKS